MTLEWRDSTERLLAHENRRERSEKRRTNMIKMRGPKEPMDRSQNGGTAQTNGSPLGWRDGTEKARPVREKMDDTMPHVSRILKRRGRPSPSIEATVAIEG